MSDVAAGRALYLETLSRLHRSWSHEARSHLGNVALQLELLNEHLSRGATDDPAKLRAPLERARQGVARLEHCVDRYLGAAPARSSNEGLDALLAEIGDLIDPFARERRVKWTVAADGAPGAMLPADTVEPVREALAVASAGAIESSREGDRVELGVEVRGSRAVVWVEPGAGAASPWLESARAALGSAGEIRGVGDASRRVEVEVALVTEGR